MNVAFSELFAFKKDMEDADFWLKTTGKEKGTVSKEFVKGYLGVKVKDPDKVDAGYAYYLFEYMHMQGLYDGMPTVSEKSFNEVTATME